jgi:hypothetical protein
MGLAVPLDVRRIKEGSTGIKVGVSSLYYGLYHLVYR